MKLSSHPFKLDSNPESITTKGFLALEGPFSFSTNTLAALKALAIGILGLCLICLASTELPLRWLISRPAAVLLESLFAALMGKLLWDCLDLLMKSFNASEAIFRTKFYAYSSLGITFIVSLFNGPFVLAILLSTVIGFFSFQATSRKRVRTDSLNSDPLILSLVLILGFQIAIPVEFLSLLVWDNFFEHNGFLIAPQVILSSILIGAVLPIPLSLAAGAYFAFYIYSWMGLAIAILGYLILFFLLRSLTSKFPIFNADKHAMIRSIEIPLIVSATVTFIFFLGRFPSELNWPPQALFVCLLTFALSIRQWHIYKLLSLGLIVAVTEITLEYLSGGILG